MPARGAPIDIDLLILFELARGGMGHGPLLLRRVHERLGESGFKLHYGTYYPALKRLLRKELITESLQPLPWKRHTSRPPKVYELTPKGAEEAKRMSAILHQIILPIEMLS